MKRYTTYLDVSVVCEHADDCQDAPVVEVESFDPLTQTVRLKVDCECSNVSLVARVVQISGEPPERW